MSGVCRHGALRRVCEICDLEEMVKALKASLAAAHDLLREDQRIIGEVMDRALTAEAALAAARAKERERWLSWMESTPYPDPPIKDKPWYSQSCFNDGCTAYRNMLRSALRDEEEK